MNFLISIYRSKKVGKQVGEYKQYRIPYTQGMTVLDVLMHVYKHLDPTIAFRYECRQGICGTCGLMLNGIPVLSCSTQIDPKVKKNIIEPLANFPVEKDLIVNLKPVLKKFMTIKPYLEKINEVRISKTTANQSKPFRKCIECGCCIAGSKILPREKEILDPMSLVKIARFMTDPRDGIKRKTIAQDGGVSMYNNEETQKLTQICPRGVPIDQAIELLKQK